MYKLFHALFSKKLFLKNFTWEYCRVHNFSAKIVHNQKVGVEALLVGPTKLHIKFFVHQKFKNCSPNIVPALSSSCLRRPRETGEAQAVFRQQACGRRGTASLSLRRCAACRPFLSRASRRGSTSGCWLWNEVRELLHRKENGGK